MEGWMEYKLGDLLIDKGYIRGPFGSALRRPELKSSGIPVYEQLHAIYNTRVFRFFIDEPKFKELKRFQVRPNDLIISCSGTVGKISIISDKDPLGIISQALLILRVKTDLISSKFLYFFLTNPKGNESLLQASHGSVQVNIAQRSTVENIDLLLPPLHLQNRVAEILSALDDKIELNRQMNHTLEQMAQALYKHYFIDDIDPENLPEGWSVGKLGDVLSLEYGKSLREPERHGGKYPVIGSSGIVGYHSTFLVKAAGVVVGRKGNAGSVLWCSKDFFPIDTTFYVINSLSDKRFHYLFFLLKSLKLKDYNSDSAVPGLNRNQAHDAEIIIPPDKIIETFNSYTVRLFDLIESNTEEINNLSVIRNTLLPKLISGELIPADLHSIEQAV